jgi:acetyl-CoA acyltransferase
MTHTVSASSFGREVGSRVAIVDALRTPFAKQGTAYKSLSALDLGVIVVSELLERSGVSASDIERVVYGQVIPSLQAPNIAREIVLSTRMPRATDAFSVSRACATGYQSLVSVCEAIHAGDIACAIAGGADSASDIPMALSKGLASALLEFNAAKNMAGKIAAFRKLRPQDLAPTAPALTERSTGLSMGQSAEKMAKENHIARADQDAVAHRSHERAAAGWSEGFFSSHVMHVHVPPQFAVTLAEDNLVRKDSNLQSYSKLKPVFDRKHGSVTAGNSSPLTDGASALLVMREDKAQALGLRPLGYVRSYAFAALDPSEQLLMGPAYATPVALERARLTLQDIDVIDMHEAFSAQVLSVTQAFESQEFAQKKLGQDKPIGAVDWEKLNLHGGSIAIGHPFAATGARQVMQSLWELRNRGKGGGGLALCTACAAGGLGAAMILEAA